MKSVYIILVNWNGGRDTVVCLDSLIRLNYPNYKIVVCDNGSSDDSLDVIKRWASNQGLTFRELSDIEGERGYYGEVDSPLIIIRSKSNLGFAGGNNVGMRLALTCRECSYIWLLNNDTAVEPDSLTRLVERIEQQPSAGMCGSTVRFYNNPERIQALGGGYYCQWIGIPWHYGRFNGHAKEINRNRAEKWMNYVEGASILVTRQFIEEIGLMCEDYFLYFEEADWAARSKGRFDLAYAPESIVYHKVGGSIGTSSNPLRKSYTCDYFNIRNRIIFTRKFYPEALPTVYLILLGEIVIRLMLCKWDRVVMIVRLLFGHVDKQLELMRDLQTQL